MLFLSELFWNYPLGLFQTCAVLLGEKVSFDSLPSNSAPHCHGPKIDNILLHASHNWWLWYLGAALALCSQINSAHRFIVHSCHTLLSKLKESCCSPIFSSNISFPALQINIFLWLMLLLTSNFYYLKKNLITMLMWYLSARQSYQRVVLLLTHVKIKCNRAKSVYVNMFQPHHISTAETTRRETHL